MNKRHANTKTARLRTSIKQRISFMQYKICSLLNIIHNQYEKYIVLGVYA